jgi:RNA polymerase sigma factor (TIGR02999 family)
VYAELHRIARRNLAGEREGHLLQPSALVNEAFVRLMGDAPVEWANRAHFFAFSARLMRQILIDFARAQDTAKRGFRSPHVDLAVANDAVASQPSPVDFLDLDQALAELAQFDTRQAVRASTGRPQKLNRSCNSRRRLLAFSEKPSPLMVPAL